MKLVSNNGANASDIGMDRPAVGVVVVVTVVLTGLSPGEVDADDDGPRCLSCVEGDADDGLICLNCVEGDVDDGVAICLNCVEGDKEDDGMPPSLGVV